MGSGPALWSRRRALRRRGSWFAQVPAVGQEATSRGPRPLRRCRVSSLLDSPPPHPPRVLAFVPCVLVSSGSDNVVDVIAAHGLLPCSKCLFGRFLGRVGEVERAVPEVGHVRRRRRDIRVDPVRRAVVCGAGQRPRGPGERAGRSSREGRRADE